MTGLNSDEINAIFVTKGLMTSSQYEHIYKIIKHRAPCNLLVFGLGEDSYLWKQANKGGITFFVEDSKDWIDEFPLLKDSIIQYTYNSSVLMDIDKLDEETLVMHNLPEIDWNIVIIDAPVGHPYPCSKECPNCKDGIPAPGRIIAIITTSKIINKSIVIVDDMNRHIEKTLANRKFGQQNLSYFDGKLGVFNLE